ncbi:hypothetical protein ACFLY5_00190 [Patescibacteria group bacterium]
MKNKDKYKTIMQMSPWDFDQTPNGWRKIDKTEGHIIAARIIQDYISINTERIKKAQGKERSTSLEIMNFHIGQLLASEGQEHYLEAIEKFKLSFRKNQECWNAYVSATIGHLENDMKKIEDAIKTIKSSVEKDKRSGNIAIVENFKKALESDEHDYITVYTWHREQ